MTFRLEQFDYDLPPSLIAQEPCPEREGSRLLVLRRDGGLISHHRMSELPDLLPARAVFVINDTRVLPARLAARRLSGGRVEILLLEQLEPRRWTSIVRSSKPPRVGEQLAIEGRRGAESATADPAPGHATVLTPVAAGRAVVELSQEDLPQRLGTMPLPPYIQREARNLDEERYQTVYARDPGSVAAPTAGLHLSEALLARIGAAGGEIERITLHVGPGTFVPVRCEDPRDHELEEERFVVPERTARAIARAHREARPVVAVGTTVVRALETTAGEPGDGRTGLFIWPGFEFRVVSALLTNFHLPRSTLLMLVCAFAGRELVLQAYAQAVARAYRFYSYGDGMLIL